MSILQSDGIDGVLISDNCFSKKREKIIIDTDPGIVTDLEILGLTTIFGNVTTEDATRNALHLCELAGRPDIPVAEGSTEPLKRGTPRIADFVHGSNGLGTSSSLLPNPRNPRNPHLNFWSKKFLNTRLTGCIFSNKSLYLDLGYKERLFLCKQSEESGLYLVELSLHWEMLILLLKQMYVVYTSNIYGDPEAADIVFTCGANIDVVGINITTQVKMTDMHLDELRKSKGRHVQFLGDICKFYRDWHVKSDGVYGIFLHDPVSFVALVRPDLFTFKKGVVRVETQGICVGHTLMDQGLKKWNSSNPWSDFSPVSVAWTVNVEEVLNYVNEILMKP
ncbi:hypothetical protein DH2020_026342 [Rehmannia glutinosa]|uniref:Inosine/uridine-preferring nucleoside hydrolase domain-containing protein n=1 Tax=Rehmannia glutinosa TaxID=99300 RepID=A0ABR0VY23_REHGL